MLHKCLAVASAGVLLAAGVAHTQSRFERSFVTGEVSRYRVQLTVRSELEGQSAVEAGGQAYAKPLSQIVEMTLAWTATRRVAAVRPDGSADIAETLDEFSVVDVSSPAHTLEPESRELRDALRDSLDRWRNAEPHVLNYRETKLGQLTGVPLKEGPRLDDEPPLVTPWLLRALRPTAALPEREFRPGERWQEPRAVRMEGWTNVTGTESGEWLAGPTATLADPPSVRLHIVQQISGGVPGPAGTDGRGDTIGEGRFHAESLSTIALEGAAGARVGPGHLLAAMRSASREITRVLEPVAGLPEPPRFRARISAQVQITLLP